MTKILSFASLKYQNYIYIYIYILNHISSKQTASIGLSIHMRPLDLTLASSTYFEVTSHENGHFYVYLNQPDSRDH